MDHGKAGGSGLLGTSATPSTSRRVGSADDGNNLVIQKLHGFLLMGLALADDSPVARDYGTAAANHWLRSTHVSNKRRWTGLQQGGSSNYGTGTQLSENFMMTDGSQDRSLPGRRHLWTRAAGLWLQGQIPFYLYAALPDKPSSSVPYGQPDIAEAPTFHSLSLGRCSRACSEQPRTTQDTGTSTGGTTSHYTAANLTYGSNERLIPYALMFLQEADAKVDYRAVLPIERAFNVVDGAARMLWRRGSLALDGRHRPIRWSS